MSVCQCKVDIVFVFKKSYVCVPRAAVALSG